MTESADGSSPAPVRTAGVVCLRGQEVLLIKPGPESKHPAEVCGLPAGRLEEGEDYVDCGLRELEEEVGIRLAAEDLTELPQRYTASLTRRDGSSVLMTWVVFYAEIADQQARATPEAIPFWARLDSLQRLTLQKNVPQAIEQAVALRAG